MVPQEFTGLGPKWPKSAQKGGTPCFEQFFRKTKGTHPTLSPKSEKKWATPRWTSRWGGGPHFFPKFGDSWDLPRIVFLEGAYITNHNPL